MDPCPLPREAVVMAMATPAVAFYFTDLDIPADMGKPEAAEELTKALADIGISTSANRVVIGPAPKDKWSRRSASVVGETDETADKWVKALVEKHPSQAIMVDLPNMGGIKFHDGAQKAAMMMLPLNGAPTKRVAMARGVLLVSDSCNDERLKILHAAVIRAVVTTATRHLEKERANVLQLRATANDAKLSDAARASAQAKLEYTPGRWAARATLISRPRECYAATMAPAHVWKVMDASDATIQLYPRDDTDLALKKDRSDVAKAFQRQGGICTVEVATGGSIKKEEARMGGGQLA